ncbi:unnamed protein product [Cyprideis torosa]|uniref:Uncharacterized protein n=1 Tax=Cyprideis torosa TaxID=163714 RepID=A0A7R8ZTI2_9CRUS|nr:unnamed protein product [Cyprideis torosa]CAG0904108.1 unnamed protein product [Cyprideis torosa]
MLFNTTYGSLKRRRELPPPPALLDDPCVEKPCASSCGSDLNRSVSVPSSPCHRPATLKRVNSFRQVGSMQRAGRPAIIKKVSPPTVPPTSSSCLRPDDDSSFAVKPLVNGHRLGGSLPPNFCNGVGSPSRGPLSNGFGLQDQYNLYSPLSLSPAKRNSYTSVGPDASFPPPPSPTSMLDSPDASSLLSCNFMMTWRHHSSLSDSLGRGRSSLTYHSEVSTLRLTT